MAQSNQAVWGVMDEEVRAYKGPPSLAITEHWNYEDKGKDFFGGYCYMSQGPLPQLWANTQIERSRAVGRPPYAAKWRTTITCRPENRRRNAAAGIKPRHARRRARSIRAVASRASPIHGATTTKRLIDHSLKFMTQALQAIDAKRHLDAGRRHLPPERHRAHGRRSANQRCRRRLPELGHPQSLDLRRVGVSDRRAASIRL